MIRERFLTTGDAESWNKFLPANRSVFGSHGYARICEAFRNCTARLYIAQMGEASICYPVFLRSLSDLDFAADLEGKWDTTTPEFTGPMMFGYEPSLAETFPVLRDEAFRRERVIAEFAHLNPWRDSASLLPEGSEYNREIVWVNTSLMPEELWSTHVEHSCRKNIKTAQANEVRIFEGTTDQHLQAFHRIYKATMRRNNALPAYFFSLDFFRAFRNELPDNSRFALAESHDQIVAATLYLHDEEEVFSFLGGADAEFQHLRPSNLVIWETIRWAHYAGKKRLILGGGYKPGDGIFRFKSTFSRFRKSFHVYKKIHIEHDYNLLERRRRNHLAMNGEPIGFFPSYRYTGRA
jgi:serine/alanine adding enzyme